MSSDPLFNNIVSSDIIQASNYILAGDLVAFPSETVYGLGADASNCAAVAKVFAAKGRPRSHPLIVHISNLKQLDQFVTQIPPLAAKLMQLYWPGPLTLILPKKPNVLSEASAGLATIAVRMPDNAATLQLIEHCQRPLVGPSANSFGKISPTSAEHVYHDLKDTVAQILLANCAQIGIESTIVDCTKKPITILRPGAITASMLATNGIKAEYAAQLQAQVPGNLKSHYAPNTPTALINYSKELHEHIKGRVGYIGLQPTIIPNNWKQICLSQTANIYAQKIYNALQTFDQQQLDLILIERPPQDESWRAINDRLKKATADFALKNPALAASVAHF